MTGLIILVVELAICAAALAGLYKAFEKMGRPGWEGLVPFYNFWILTQMMGKDTKWFVFCCIPFANIIPMKDVARAWGKDDKFAIGLALLPFVCWPILGFTEQRYQGPTTAAGFPVTAPQA